MTAKLSRPFAALCAAAMFVTVASEAAVSVAQAHPSQGAAVHAARHHRRHHRGIPQHNGGDHDSDNRGGPSDGDGNV